MKGNLYTLVFAAVLGTVCATLLTAAATFTRSFQEANKKAEENRNILAALKVPVEPGAAAETLVKVFQATIREERLGDLTLYTYVPQGESKAVAVAVRFEGPGLWGPVRGFLALEADRRTIRGITFYEHEETPGLGGEIESEGFRQQFAGKSIYDAKHQPGIRISRGDKGEDINAVDGITGATLTCDKVQAMLNTLIEKIAKETN